MQLQLAITTKCPPSKYYTHILTYNNTITYVSISVFSLFLFCAECRTVFGHNSTHARFPRCKLLPVRICTGCDRIGIKNLVPNCRHHSQQLFLSKHDVNYNFGEQLRLLSIQPRCKLSSLLLFNISHNAYVHSSFTASIIKFRIGKVSERLKQIVIANEGVVFVHTISVQTVEQW